MVFIVTHTHAQQMNTRTHRLYSDPKQRPKYNLAFILTGGGKFNYFGTKRFIESELEDQDGGKMADYTLCLEGLASRGEESLHVHVSKPPPEGSDAHQLIQALNLVGLLGQICNNRYM